jgi:hypothetical protein
MNDEDIMDDEEKGKVLIKILNSSIDSTLNLAESIGELQKFIQLHDMKNSGGLKYLRDLICKIFTDRSKVLEVLLNETTSNYRNQKHAVQEIADKQYGQRLVDIFLPLVPFEKSPSQLPSKALKLKVCEDEIFEAFSTFAQSDDPKEYAALIDRITELRETVSKTISNSCS